MNNGRRIPDDAHSVANAVATALHRPLVVAWRARASDDLDVVGPLVEPTMLANVAATLRSEIDTFNGKSRRLRVGPRDEWTAMAATATDGGTTQHQVVVAVPDGVDDLTLEAIVESVGGALQAVLGRLWWQTLTEAGPDVVVVLDATRLITHVSNSVRVVLGYRPSDLIGTDVATLVDPDHVPDLVASIDHRLGEPRRSPVAQPDPPLRARVRHSDGSWRWLETVSADRLDDPVIRGVILTCRDVTDLVEAHLALQAEQERMGFILDNSVDIIAVFRGDGTAEFVTPSVQRVLGWPVEQFLGRTAFELIHPDDFEQVATSLGSTLQEPGERRAGRFRFLRQDGTWAWMEARSMIAPGRSDVAVVSARDVTQEMEALARARAEEARYRTLVEASPQAIAIHQDGNLVFVNQAAGDLLGADHPGDLLGWPIARFSPTSPLTTRQRSAALERGEIVGPFETSVTRLDGSTAVLEITSIPTTWDGGEAVQVVAFDITERRRTESLLAHTALHDPVSGLPNRSLLADRIDQAIRRARRTGERSALLFCDIDHFKVINDALGHTAGDEVLTDAAQRLRSLIRETDTVARFGGDELVVLSQDLGNDDDAMRLVARIRGAFDEPFTVSDKTIHLTVSTGVATISGAEDRDVLLSLAESAMFAAKDAGRNRWVVADESLRARTGDRLRLQSELHASLDAGTGLALHLQPEVDLASRHTIGFEALIRWSTPDGTNVPPDRFLPIASDAGLMHRIGGFVVAETAAALSRIPPTLSDSWLAINAAPEELEHPDFASQIQQALDLAGIDPHRLCLEITEHSIMRDPPGVANALQPLRNRGVAIAIDDFGTGYSSLAYLARFQPEFVKIDRSFTSDAVDRHDQRSIIEAVLHLSESLGITSIAEGIETEEQADLLLDLGCEMGQGWFFARPIDIDTAFEQAPR